eukprot:1566369-Prymnesium_polylepis.1
MSARHARMARRRRIQAGAAAASESKRWRAAHTRNAAPAACQRDTSSEASVRRSIAATAWRSRSTH